MRKYLFQIFAVTIVFMGSSCKKFLNVVPDDVATLNNAFATRIEAEKYLFTCYSYMPKNGDINDDPGMVGSDELWYSIQGGYSDIVKGNQSVVTPIGDKWGTLFEGVRDCNIFLDNINKVPDIQETERRRWVAEVLFLKAYYNFYLVKMYGPVPLMKKNLPVNVGVNRVKIFRAPVDSCFGYIIQLINEAEPDLPLTINDPTSELGRVTQPIATAFKAKVLVYAASPLFNGNTDEAGLKNSDGTQLFDQTFSKAKWDSAAVACKRAIDICQEAGMKLYYYQPALQQYNLTDTIITQLSIRNSVCESWNTGIIWANTQTNTAGLQTQITPHWGTSFLDNPSVHGELSPPLKIAEMFYSEHGVPIEEDKTWNYNSRYSLQTAGDSDELYVHKGYTGAHMNFDRGPRFYADLGFDGGVWYGQGVYNDANAGSLYYLETKFGQRNAFVFPFNSGTGYFVKKLVHYQNVITSGGYSVTPYFFPIMRLSGLYLLYAEALNESEGPVADVYKYINLVRQRDGLPSVQSSWSNYSINPTEYTTKSGMEKIIHRERLIELAFEGQRFWDLRRWKEADDQLNSSDEGWDITQESASAYYRPTVIYKTTFGLKDYFWPIKESTVENNYNLAQNLGW